MMIASLLELRRGKKKPVWACLVSPTPAERLEEASNMVRGFIEQADLTMHTFTGGRIIGDGEQVIARVSYNGKVWGPEPWRSGAVPLYNPYKEG